MKPSWDDAPEWAKFMAKDNDEAWYFYESRPTWNEPSARWDPEAGQCQRWDPGINGNGTLEPRP